MLLILFLLIKVAAIREGMTMIVPVPLLSLCSSTLMERMVCGSEVLDIQMLKLIAKLVKTRL